MHHLQKTRAYSILLVKKKIAQAMPSGADNKKLKAILMQKYGFSKNAVNEYLEILAESGEIERVSNTWKLVIGNDNGTNSSGKREKKSSASA